MRQGRCSSVPSYAGENLSTGANGRSELCARKPPVRSHQKPCVPSYASRRPPLFRELCSSMEAIGGPAPADPPIAACSEESVPRYA
jgi:hypothetical protein